MSEREGLAAGLDELNTNLVALRRDLGVVGRRQDRMTGVGVVLAVIGLIVILLGAAALTQLYTSDERIQSRIEQNNQLICPVIGILASTDPPRSTEAGRAAAAKAQGLYRNPQFGCR